VSYDRDGEMAARGRINRVLLDELLAHPYLEKEPPKTTGREEFGAHFINEIYERGLALGLSPEDLIATVTAFTVESIAVSYERFIYPHFTPDEIVLGGGGAYNRTLFHWLQRRLAPLPVLCHEDFGISSDAKEAILFAVLANETIHGIPANIPAATGSKWPVVLGKVVF
jgi:anhydro-N-acetylmuramic acid kinase